MTMANLLEDFPVIQDIGNKTSQIELGRSDLRLTVIESVSGVLPDYFQTAVYSLNFLVRGKITANINHQLYEISAPCFSSILINQMISVTESSDDVLQYVLSFSPQFADELNLRMPLDSHINAYMRPVFPMTEQQMQVAMHYLTLLREVIQSPEISNAHDVVVDLVRSLAYYIHGFYNRSFSSLYTLSRAEELTGRFLSEVEQHCREHHNISWYASEMNISPKYLANVVKQVTGRTAGDCITQNLVKQAKSLLLATSLSVQEIADCLGFQNQSHFGTFLRRTTGLNPKVFRQKGIRIT